jgi:RTA1 like protein
MATIPAPGYPSFKNYTLATFNQSLLINNNLCTLQTCPLVLDGEPLAHLDYLPDVGGNGLYAGIFGLFILLQIPLAIRYRTIGYFIGMLGGLLCEFIGYIGRVLMHSNPFIDVNFIMYLCCLTIGLAFLTAAIYFCLLRIVVIYSEEAARFKLKTYTFFFIFCDIVSLTF